MQTRTAFYFPTNETTKAVIQQSVSSKQKPTPYEVGFLFSQWNYPLSIYQLSVDLSNDTSQL